MSTPIEPTAIYPPGQSPAYNYGSWRSTQNPYQQPSEPFQARPPSRIVNAYNRIPNQQRRVRLQGLHVPPILSNRSVVFNMWLIAMILVGFDEWHNLNILPRPARLWNTSLVYGLLMMLGFVDVMVPIANAFAIGFTVVLLYQYFGGDLTPSGGQSATQAAQAALQPVGYSGTATVPAPAVSTGANPTGGAPTLNGA